MGTPDSREMMLKRHEIVVRIIEVNSRVLRLDNEINSLDIERRSAEREFGAAHSSDRRDALASIELRAVDLGAKRHKLLTEKTWLEQTLDDFDSAAAGETIEPSAKRMS